MLPLVEHGADPPGWRSCGSATECAAKMGPEDAQALSQPATYAERHIGG